MKQHVWLSTVSILVAVSARAGLAETRLICENPRREYLVIYRPGASELVLNPDSDGTRYPILVDDNTDAQHVVTASTPGDGPTARLHLRPYLKMEFWTGGQLLQTDGCYSAR